jgi:hypothetical protein
MAKATDKSWFGVFTNLVAAQDWYIKNDQPSGDVTVKMRAASGLGDMFFMMEDNPQDVTKAYHTVVGYAFASP